MHFIPAFAALIVFILQVQGLAVPVPLEVRVSVDGKSPSPVWKRAQIEGGSPSPVWKRVAVEGGSPPSPVWKRVPVDGGSPPSPVWKRASVADDSPPSPSQWVSVWPRTPLTAIVSGPFDAGNPAPRAVSADWFDVVCLSCISTRDVKPRLSAASRPSARAVPQPFDRGLWGSPRLLPLLPRHVPHPARPR
ncbi:hypothetical protein B0H17DRAFT_1203849 [Mycena rosella]|uniref:Secreted protein n=1 Tax=Mycena rosella TaxID=1033263 RepID=A0AAD7GBR7_MYCRO|nr:hypothetical protein B0H17DRAFT_1203849 [Mycena rosella]